MRNVLITGASRGLGLAMARRLAADGFRVVAIARTPTETLDALIEDTQGAVRFVAYDLMQVEGLHALVKEIRADVGPIYGLVNNAGLGTTGLLANLSQAKIEALIRLNTLSPIMLTRAVSRGMLVQGGGRIVNVSSIVASTGFSGLSVYSATKASLLGFTRSLARELGPAHVTVNAVAPGFIETDMTGEMGEQPLTKVKNRSALRRLAEAEDVAAAVSYLMSEGARNVTGQVLTVDAGTTA
jgi:3-oxoacyl-[acyl-carrier protein] reductase